MQIEKAEAQCPTLRTLDPKATTTRTLLCEGLSSEPTASNCRSFGGPAQKRSLVCLPSERWAGKGGRGTLTTVSSYHSQSSGCNFALLACVLEALEKQLEERDREELGEGRSSISVYGKATFLLVRASQCRLLDGNTHTPLSDPSPRLCKEA